MTFPVAPAPPWVGAKLCSRSIFYLDCSRGVGSLLMAVASEGQLGNVCCVVLQM